MTEEITSLVHEFPKDETYESTVSLFTMLSSLKEKVERDRTFVVAKVDTMPELVTAFKELGFTLKEIDAEELRAIKL